MPKPTGPGNTIDLEIRATLAEVEGAEKRPEVAAYVFTKGGALLGTSELDAQGNGRVAIPATREATEVRVVVGPRVEEGAAKAAELLRRGATERHLRLDPSARPGLVDLQVLPGIWKCWLLGRCFVRGTLVKRVATGGYSLEYPVCNATVEIYEVDSLPIFLAKLPDFELERLRDIILHPRPLPEPNPEPLPGPFPGPFPAERATARPLIARKMKAVQGHSHADAAMALAESGEAGELRYAARTGSRTAFEAALVTKAELIRPLICLLYPHWVIKQRIGTATTDECGHFQETVFLGCHNHDKPDLYFRATQKFLFFDIPIYAPTPVACYTWWNYQCGTEVKLVTYHPWALTCQPCPPVNVEGNWVLFTAIGNVSLARIRGCSSVLQGSTNAGNRGLTDDGRPFGGALRPRLLFDSALRDSLGVMYYKLWWRRAGAGGWNEILGDVSRHYQYKVNGQPVLDVYPLGPKTVAGADENNLYEIPPTVPPQGLWSVPNPVEDTQNGIFESKAAAPGITYDLVTGNEVGTDQAGDFEIMLELFDTAGKRVDIAAKNIRYFVPTSTDLSGTINTEQASALGLVSGNQMIIPLHIDNNPTFAEIDAATIGAASADPCCGVLDFNPGDMVTLPWRAKHKNGFANWSVAVKRVDQVVFSAGGPVGLGSHSTTQSASSLMNTSLPEGCEPDGCDVAGFASLLYVDALATDGWSILNEYDSSDFEAFVLSKQ